MNPIIYFISPGHQNLPELTAYLDYCLQHDIEAYSVSYTFDFSQERRRIVKWYFMGIPPLLPIKDKKNIIVYEYLSLSTGKISNIKDVIKRLYSLKADLCIYLNDTVKTKLSFPFNVKNIAYRDMGVSELFLHYINKDEKKYDFVYCGALDEEREIDSLLNNFVNGKLRNYTILIIGEKKDYLNSFSDFDNITFIGKVPYSEVPGYLSLARCAINFIPNKRPYNIQTSTKLLEYISLKMPVLSTKYAWVSDFQHKYNAPILFFDETLSTKAIDQFLNGTVHIYPDMSEFSWEAIISNSRVFDTILEKFNRSL